MNTSGKLMLQGTLVNPIAAELQGIVIKIKNKNSVLNHKKFEIFPTIPILFAKDTANDICKLNNNNNNNNVTSQVKMNKKDRLIL